jgi:uncharacterized delta-60 repeat protein
MKTLKLCVSCTLFLFVSSWIFAGGAIAQPPGTLDPSFGTGGSVTTSFGGSTEAIRAAQILQDERIVVVGESASGPNTSNNIAVARYLENGLIDTDFGTGGVTRIDGGGGVADYGTALAIQPDGKILAAGLIVPTGSSYSNFGVVRLNANGLPDTDFGTGGIANYNMAPSLASNDYATAIAQQSDGKIVVGGVALATEGMFTYQRFGLLRFDAAGDLDATFGTAGSVIAPSPEVAGADYLTAIARLPNGALPDDDKITVVGYTAARNVAIVRRYTAGGQPDASFGVGGQVFLNAALSNGVYSGVSVIFAAVLQPDGRLVVVGQGMDRGFAIIRLLDNGSLDSSFGTNGRAHVKFSGPSFYDEPFAVSAQINGKIVVAGYFDGPPNDDFAVARLLPNGAPDPTFGGGTGRAIVPISVTTDDRALALAVAPSGRLVLGGWVQDPQAVGQQRDFALVRLFGDPVCTIFCDSFEDITD